MTNDRLEQIIAEMDRQHQNSQALVRFYRRIKEVTNAGMFDIANTMLDRKSEIIKQYEEDIRQEYSHAYNRVD